LLQEIRADFTARAEQKDLQFNLTVETELPESVQGDRDRLQQILNNLLGNAIKFTQQGSIALNIRVTPIDDTSVELYCAVQDTGIGIHPDAQARIFDSFVQVDGSLTRLHQGTGLGLSISQQLVEMMGSKIELSSELGVGSTFSFAIHLARPCAEDETKSVL
jgi:signal transduction histidine kinase